MAYTSDFLTIIEQARKYKGLSVKSLCEHIVSERTYYRFLREDTETPFDILQRLADRLELNLNQIMMFSMFFSREYSFLYTFIYRVQVAFYDDMSMHYEGIKKQVFDNASEKLLADAYIKKYEYEIGQITKAVYQEALEQILKAFGEKQDILKDLVTVFYYGIRQQSQEALVALAKHVDHYAKNLSVHFQTIIIDELLYLFTAVYAFDADLFNRLLKQYKIYAKKVTINHFIMRIHFYEAYLAKRNGEQDRMNSELYEAVLMLNYMYGGDQLKTYFEWIEKVSELDIMNFMSNYTKHQLLEQLVIE